MRYLSREGGVFLVPVVHVGVEFEDRDAVYGLRRLASNPVLQVRGCLPDVNAC